jgi:hypothetical protein
MKNHDDNDNPYPMGDSDYDSEDDYGQPYDWSLARQHGHFVRLCFQPRPAKQPVSAVDADVSNPS